MSLTYNGTSVKNITYNGNTVKQVTMNNVVVWSAEKTITNIQLGTYHVAQGSLYVDNLTVASGVQSLTSATFGFEYEYNSARETITSSDLGKKVTVTLIEGNNSWRATMSFTPTLSSSGILSLKEIKFNSDEFISINLIFKLITMTYTPAE